MGERKRIMLNTLDFIFEVLFYQLIPFALHAGVFLFALAGMGYLGDIKKGYSYLHTAGGLFCMSGICACFYVGSNAVGGGWVIGMLLVIIAALTVTVVAAFGIPTVIIAVVLWGFLLVGPGEINVENDFDDDTDSSYVEDSTEQDPLLDDYSTEQDPLLDDYSTEQDPLLDD
jgi:hypothetical protein